RTPRGNPSRSGCWMVAVSMMAASRLLTCDCLPGARLSRGAGDPRKALGTLEAARANLRVHLDRHVARVGTPITPHPTPCIDTHLGPRDGLGRHPCLQSSDRDADR